jgi:signal transduction histidine kinase
VQAQSSARRYPMRMPTPDESTVSVLLPRPRRVRRSRAVFLADASKRLAASLDLNVTMRCMTDLSVPELGAACLVFQFVDGRCVGPVIARHADARLEGLLTTLTNSAIHDESRWQPVLIGVARSGLPAMLSQPALADLLDEHSALVEPPADLGLKTALLVPVMLGGRVLAIVAFMSDRIRHYGLQHLRLAEELSSRFAFALEAAQLYQASTAALEDTGESLATTVHDLMSPLTYIKGSANRLRRIEQTISDASTRTELSSRLEAIDSAANRMASALTALLQTTGPRSVPWPRANSDRTDLVMLARRATAEQQMLAPQHSIVVTKAPAALEGAWNGNRIERTLSNLIGNAVKYSPVGSTVEVCLTNELDAEGCWAVVRVSDHGMGIPAADLPFIFEPFRRGSNVGDISGTGLGLASVWQTVKTHQGRLWIDSEEGRGTCVTVRLPL